MGPAVVTETNKTRRLVLMRFSLWRLRAINESQSPTNTPLTDNFFQPLGHDARLKNARFKRLDNAH